MPSTYLSLHYHVVFSNARGLNTSPSTWTEGDRHRYRYREAAAIPPGWDHQPPRFRWYLPLRGINHRLMAGKPPACPDVRRSREDV